MALQGSQDLTNITIRQSRPISQDRDGNYDAFSEIDNPNLLGDSPDFIDRIILDVTDFGLKLDGSDETSLFQRTLLTTAGKTLYIPSDKTLGLCGGVTLPENTNIIGPGTIKKLDGGLSTDFMLVLSENNTIQNLNINGNSDNLTNADPQLHHEISVVGSNHTIKNCNFLNSPGSSIAGSTNIENIKISNCSFNEWTDHAIYFSTNVKNVQISTNNFTSVTGGETIKFREDGRIININNNNFDTYSRWVMLQHSLSNPSGISNVNISSNVGYSQLTPFLFICSANSNKKIEYVNITSNSASLNPLFTGVKGALDLDWNNIVSSKNIVVNNNTFRNLVGFGAVGDSSGYASERLIDNNIFVIETGRTITFAPFSFNKSRNIRISNNIIRFDSFSYGNYLFYIDSGSNVDIINNTIDVNSIWLMSLANSADVTLVFKNNNIKTLSRRLIVNGQVSNNSRIILNDNYITQSDSYPFIFDTVAVTGVALSKYSITSNIINNKSEGFLGVGSGSPSGVVIGYPGYIYLRNDGSNNTSLYVKEIGNGTTSGWSAK